MGLVNGFVNMLPCGMLGAWLVVLVICALWYGVRLVCCFVNISPCGMVLGRLAVSLIYLLVVCCGVGLLELLKGNKYEKTP